MTISCPNWLPLTLCLLALPLSTSCNVFSPLDSPDGDAQMLSAARACFDKGDIACARDYYSKLSTSMPSVAASEEAFAILDEAGISMGAFMEAMGDGEGPKGLGILASKLSRLQPGRAKRMAIVSAHAKVASITDNELRGLVRFMTAFSLAAAILAEDAGANGDPYTFEQVDLVRDPAACEANVLDPTSCAPALNTKIILGTMLDFNIAADLAQVNADTPTLGMFNGALKQVSEALGPTELGAGGDFEGTVEFSKQMTNKSFDSNTGERVYRNELIRQGVGK